MLYQVEEYRFLFEANPLSRLGRTRCRFEENQLAVDVEVPYSAYVLNTAQNLLRTLCWASPTGAATRFLSAAAGTRNVVHRGEPEAGFTYTEKRTD
jgi:hypothetical protein